MALLTDESPNTVETLKAIETSIADVASIELIDVDIKMGVALEEISESLMVYLIQLGSQDPQASTRRQIGVSNVVMTPPLRRWHAMQSIALIYRDAYHNQLNARYLEKWKYFNTAAGDVRKTLLQTGLGLVNSPVPQAPVPVAGIAVGQWAAGSYVVQVAWVDARGQVGSPSDATTVEIAVGNAPLVQVSEGPPEVAGWNVYVGPIGSTPTQQNSAPLSFSSAWVAPPFGPVQGNPVGNGQSPDRYLTDNQSFWRR